MEFFGLDLLPLLATMIFGFLAIVTLAIFSKTGQRNGRDAFDHLLDPATSPLLAGRGEESIRKQIEIECRGAGFDVLDVRFQYIEHGDGFGGRTGRRTETRVFFDVRDRETLERHSLIAQVQHGVALFHLPGGRGRQSSAQEIPQAISPEQEREQRILQETNRRLDLLMSDRAALMQHDADGNGMIDSQEWEKVRAEVRAQVEQELGATWD
ncbi:MAG: hypothetical protein VYE40_00815 [Myxococcota bacterium]|nr:hypothetical protein [Myxococcota bacterium]MEC9439620.1 hypothetical protein [Myxococcota bacterium]